MYNEKQNTFKKNEKENQRNHESIKLNATKCSTVIQNISLRYPIYHFDDESHEQRKR